MILNFSVLILCHSAGYSWKWVLGFCW